MVRHSAIYNIQQVSLCCVSVTLVVLLKDGRVGVAGESRPGPVSGQVTQSSVSAKYKVPPAPTIPAATTPAAPPAAAAPAPPADTGPNLMQKLTGGITGGLNEMTGGDNSVDHILSKGKELIFMKFGLGKWVSPLHCQTAFLLFLYSFLIFHKTLFPVVNTYPNISSCTNESTK